MKIYTTLLSTTLLLTTLAPLHATELIPETDAAYQKRMQWFTDAQFGLFIHYGVYSTLGGEWKGKTVPKYAEWIQRGGNITPEEYIPLAANFRPDKLDADQWVKTAKEAGMKYMVITSKHHEGFCLWDSAHTKYDLGEATEFNRDILGELKAACDKHGLKFGTYYSIIDWNHPSQRSKQATNQPPMKDKAAYVAYMKAQLKELIDRYDPAIMWFDGDWARWWTMEDGIDLYNYLRKLSPNMIINNRVAKRAQFKKDYGTPEQQTPGGALDHVWEACWTVNHSWGYKKSDTKWKDINTLVQKQIDINAKGGNLLLNVGPYADGSWPQGSTDLLLQMGKWNKAHAEAVYDTDYVDLPAQNWGAVAQSKSSNADAGEIFAYVFDWPKNGKLIVDGLAAGEIKALTYDGKPLASSATKGGLEVDLSSTTPEPQATVIRIKYSGGRKAADASSIDLGLKGNELSLLAKDAKLSGKANKLENNAYIGYWTDSSDTATWTLNVPAPGKYTVKLLYSCDKRYAGSSAQLTVAGKTLSTLVTPTKGWKHFELMEMGDVNLDQVGDTRCTLGFGPKKGKALFNLKLVLFVPQAE
ncbi:MAG: alpha-L-fucosidase [Akkermansiaceae bacterium]|nr:alpha-L-fucosidase [Akkermansiaceae bacterium]